MTPLLIVKAICSSEFSPLFVSSDASSWHHGESSHVNVLVARNPRSDRTAHSAQASRQWIPQLLDSPPPAPEWSNGWDVLARRPRITPFVAEGSEVRQGPRCATQKGKPSLWNRRQNGRLSWGWASIQAGAGADAAATEARPPSAVRCPLSAVVGRCAVASRPSANADEALAGSRPPTDLMHRVLHVDRW
ncbi:uncharacterized protein UV8b_07625 [Ustilaginoidea virens]|uniref:Uncharacterized protein n=1 Tax=Ustilaginoidea virens TaxID=1159556 RepID=A0A8E5HY87_USTVR|nr:uncharacterized protein UV8b_07625 [Ustilaginoidea virens]QUC23384.1 hypothetical protein UV8b_07625 [Ustilaginoidea virens]